jgi:DNA polymerase III epsilon subunit-like protein
MPETVYLDLETTGLYPPDDEILEIAVVDDAGAVRLHSLVRPAHRTAWSDAEAIHGLTPQDVQDAPTLEALRPQIIQALRGTTVVIYNAAFDQGFLSAELETAAEVRCCMEAFAQHADEWSDWHGGFRWQTLGVAAEYVRHRWDSRAHRAVADTLACRAVWRYLTEPEERQRVEAIKADEQASWEAQAALREWAHIAQRAQEREAARLQLPVFSATEGAIHQG